MHSLAAKVFRRRKPSAFSVSKIESDYEESDREDFDYEQSKNEIGNFDLNSLNFEKVEKERKRSGRLSRAKRVNTQAKFTYEGTI